MIRVFVRFLLRGNFLDSRCHVVQRHQVYHILCLYYLFVNAFIFLHFRYVPAYSTRLNFVDGTWRLQPPNASDPMGMVDPVWTESYWDTIGLRTYKIQSSFYDNIVLLWGIAVTVFTYLLIVVSRAYLRKAMKRD